MQHQPHLYHTASHSYVFAASTNSYAESVKDYPSCASLSFFLPLILLAAILIIP